MGRSIPSTGAHALGQHLPLDTLLLAAWVAAVVGVVALLCGSRHQKSSTPKSQKSPSSFPSPPPSKTPVELEVAGDGSLHTAAAPTLLPPPPAAAKHSEEEAVEANGLHGPLAGEAPMAGKTRRKLSMTMSMKLPEGLVRIRTSRREQKHDTEESIWKKTIILGEKCKVPDDDEDASIHHGDKGNGQKNYRPRTPRSLPASRTNSFSEKEGGALVGQ